jgi:sterol desaturase/sphingolipid hydroxylase (fatty acid hydroxylase superfamily)
MIELGDELDIAFRVRQIGSASRSLLSAISASRTNYWLAYIVDFSCPVLFAYLGMRRPVGWPLGVLNLLAGWFLFTLVEYAIHRWLLHNPECFLFPLHEAHHKNPEEASAFLFPTSFVVLMPIWMLFANVLGLHGASFFLCGFSAGYLYFGTLHHLEHRVRINQIPFRWLQGRWAAHSVHHRLDQTNFGVMTSFWDYIFKTHQKQLKRKSLAR